MKQRIRIQNRDKTARIFRPIATPSDLVSHMRGHGAKTAFLWNARQWEEKDGSINYELFADEVTLAAAALAEQGLEGKRIALVGAPSKAYAAVLVATLASGGVIVPIDRERSTEDMAALLRRSSAAALFYGTGTLAEIEKLTANRSLRLFCALDEGVALPESKRAMRYTDLLALGKGRAESGYTFPERDADDVAAMLFTSGTVGESKCALLSAKNLCFAVNGGCTVTELNKADLILSVLPFHNPYEISSLLVMLNYGVTVALTDEPTHLIADMKKYRPTGMVLVPLYITALYNRLWEDNKQMKHARGLHYGIKTSNALLAFGIDLRKKLFSRTRTFFGGRLEKIISGGAPLNPSLIYAYECLGVAIYEGYGITECSPFVTMTPYYARRPGSVGLPLPDCRVRIDAAEGERGEHGYEEGEIEVSGAGVMLGYHEDEAQNEAAFTLDGYFRTGDIGYLDKDGYLYVTGRKKSVIILDNGRNVAPEELEEYLCALSEVADALVYGKKDEGGITRLHAAVLPAQALLSEHTEEEVLALLKERLTELNRRLPAFKQIGELEFSLHPFPRNAAGKLIRHSVN